MFNNNSTLNVAQELAEIPAEYQEIFRQALAQELAESEQNRTDHDILRYLRRRRDDFQRGGFIRPDGRPGLLAMSPEARYEQALPELAQSSLGEPDDTAERRQLLLKIGLFAGLALLLLFFALRGRAQRAVTQAGEAGETPAAAELTPTITPSLPEITGAEDSLQTIGGLGGSLTLGRPSALELHYRQTEETIALAIDPSRPTPRGELRYDQATMQSDKPVAVWLFGTVLNYAIGLPDSLVRNLVLGDRLILSTDTGAALVFVVSETRTGTNYEAGRLLSQNRIGLTLFSLPAPAADDVAYVLAGYDAAAEAEAGTGRVVYQVGERFTLGAAGTFSLAEVQFEQLTETTLRIVVHGQYETSDSKMVMLSLAAGAEQTMAVELAPDETGAWLAAFTLPAAAVGQPLLAELRALPDGDLALVGLGEVPDLLSRLEVTIPTAVWDPVSGRAVLSVSILNPAAGAVFLGRDFIRFATQGGDAYELTGQVTPKLPTLIGPGETLGLTVTFLPLAHPLKCKSALACGRWPASRTALPSAPPPSQASGRRQVTISRKIRPPPASFSVQLSRR
jgi:hypothetical protein